MLQPNLMKVNVDEEQRRNPVEIQKAINDAPLPEIKPGTMEIADCNDPKYKV